MAYKKGDKIIVRGEDWYKRHALAGTKDGTFVIDGVYFTPYMKEYLGQIGIIENVVDGDRYSISFNGRISGFAFVDGFIRKYHEPQVKQIKDGKNHFDKRNFVLELDYSETKMLIYLANYYKLASAAKIKDEKFQTFLHKLDDIEKALRG